MNKKQKNTPIRLNRSELAVPGSRPEFFEKAAQGDSDIVFLDLEDSVVFVSDRSQVELIPLLGIRAYPHCVIISTYIPCTCI